MNAERAKSDAVYRKKMIRRTEIQLFWAMNILIPIFVVKAAFVPLSEVLIVLLVMIALSSTVSLVGSNSLNPLSMWASIGKMWKSGLDHQIGWLK